VCVAQQAGADGTEPVVRQPAADWSAVTARLLPTTTAQVSTTEQLARLPAVNQVTAAGLSLVW